ncbi:MAG: SufD family Fe-S cluster assembly protein [Dehalococcoidia bacterium]|nr:SufD family Fe-S cluster assembly protein [Dehalococcoidia bacterium]
MTSAVEQRPRTLTAAASAALGAALFDSPAMAELRSRAAAAIERLPLPTTRERPWKYMDLSGLDLDAYTPASSTNGFQAPVVDGDYAAVLRQVNGVTISDELLAEGVKAVAFDRDGDPALQAIIDSALGSAVPFDRNQLTAAHYAFLRGGVLVNVAANAEVTLPVRIARWYNGERALVTPHTLIVSGANSRVSVIEDFRSTDDDIVALPVVEILPGPGSEIRYTALHRWGAKTRVFSEQRTITARDSALHGLSLAVGGAVVKSHIESTLAGRGSSSELFGLGVGSARQQHDFYTLQDHQGADTRSDLLFKSALKGRSRSVYYGLTRVGLGAKNADANQENRNLLLSKLAKADSDPVLEILTNDVIRASHGATAGPVDEEQLFYLQARCLPHAQAEALLVAGFLAQVLDRVPDEALRTELAESLEAKLAE